MNRKVLTSAFWIGSHLAAGLLAAGQANAAEPKAAEANAKAPEPAAESGPSIRVSGIFKPEMVYANGVNTFGRSILVAPTAASNPLVDATSDDFRQSFQLQQSRFSLHVGEGSRAEGHIEIDFVDPGLAKSSPIQGASPRLRVAYVNFKLQPGHTLTVGQQWDIFSPLNPSMMNMVAVSYQSGNSAFLRPQVIYNYTGGPWEVAGSVGMVRQNAGPAVGPVEFTMLPAVSLRISRRAGKTWYGVSAIGSSVKQGAPDGESDATYAVNAFASTPVGSDMSLKVEGYYGQNSGSLGLLTLGAGADIKDAGGFVSASYKMNAENQLWLTGSAAMVLNADDLAPGYARDAADSSLRTGGGGGIESNMQVRATYVHTPTKGLELYIEPFLFLTKYKLDAADDAANEDGKGTGYGSAFGTRYRF